MFTVENGCFVTLKVVETCQPPHFGVLKRHGVSTQLYSAVAFQNTRCFETLALSWCIETLCVSKHHNVVVGTFPSTFSVTKHHYTVLEARRFHHFSVTKRHCAVLG